MRFDFGYSEEAKLGKPYDVKLLLRLFPFVKPYGLIIGGAILLIVFITMLDLALPYVTKVAIDNYIVPKTALKSDPNASRSDDAKGPRLLTIDPSDTETAGLIEAYPHLFRVEGQKAFIAYTDLARLAPEQLQNLRRAHLNGVAKMGALFLVIVLLFFGFNYLQNLMMEYTGQKIMHDLRMRLHDHLQGRSVAFFNRNPVARLVTRVTNDVQNMNELFTSVIVFVFKDIFLLTGIAVVLLSLNWRLALISFSVLPFVVYISIRFAGQARNVFRQLRVKLAEINTRFSETIGGIKVIQLFLNEAANTDYFKQLNHANYLVGMRQVRVFAVFFPIIELLGATVLAVIIYYGGSEVVKQDLSLGALVAFIAYMRMFFRPIRDIAEKYSVMQNAMASAERLFLLLDEKDQDGAASGFETRPGSNVLDEGADPGPISELSIENVFFAYVKDENILNGVDIALKKGQTQAVVGPTGSGKTTLINLIVRFYDPDAGRILINGIDSRSIALKDLRGRMALVTQEPFLFADTIAANIFGTRKTPQNVEGILSAAHLNDLIDKLPNGIDTLLSEGGRSLSSGQRQLISIARAIARDPDLIILDEATSYIDSETEQKVQSALAQLLKDRTALIVAHRLSTARKADKIMVLNRGRIIEAGTHQKLLKNRGFYYRLYQLQQ
jgi:ATP-binding cassette, subfamily B, multidrug efflux pump